jgi:uncharacterized protein YcbK (DUF882 family)
VLKTWEKGSKFPLSTHFSSWEFDCKCKYTACTNTKIEELLIESLEALRVLTGPLVITSGFRCQAYNFAIGGVGGSQHMVGKASDLKSQGRGGQALAKLADSINPFHNGGIGTASDWIHVDIRDGKARWTYPIVTGVRILAL